MGLKAWLNGEAAWRRGPGAREIADGRGQEEDAG
jgi:hypothetical protein